MTRFRSYGILLCLMLAVGGFTLAADVSPVASAGVAPASSIAPAAEQAPQTLYGRVESIFEKGGYVMWVLLGTSVIGATFAMERFFALRRNTHIPVGMVDDVQQKLALGGVQSGKSYVEHRKDALSRVLNGVLSRPGASREEMEKVLDDELTRVLWDERRYIRPVGIVAQIAPLLGLLGTVIGLIGAFQQAAERGMEDPTLFAGGIYQALYTTAFGLMISIPFLIAYQYLRSKADGILREVEEVGQRFIFALARSGSLEAIHQDAPRPMLHVVSSTPATPAAHKNDIPDAPMSLTEDSIIESDLDSDELPPEHL